MSNLPNDQPVPPLPQGPLNAPIHGPRLPGHPGTAEPRLPGPGPQPQQGMPAPPQFAASQRRFEPWLPVVPTGYASFWRTPAYRVWRPILALIIGLLAFFLVGGVGLMLGALIGQLTGGPAMGDAMTGAAEGKMTPWVFLGNNVGLGLLIPTVILLALLLFKQTPGWICSVAGKLRWGWLGRCLLLIAPLWLVYNGLDIWLLASSGKLPELAVNPNTALLIIGILLTQPLQSAGEEFVFRGLANRGMAAFFANHRIGLIAGAIFSSLLFMTAHGAGDAWLNVYYFFFGIAACVVTWRTGGLEGAIAMHVVNNLLAMWSVPFSDISGIFERSAGTAGPEVLIGVVVVGLASALLIWQGQRRGLTNESAPGRVMLEHTQPGVPAAPQPGATFGPQANPSSMPPSQTPSAAPLAASPEPQADGPLTNPRPWQG